MSAITISREFGSLGCEAAHKAAERLGFRLVQRELINQAAIRAGTPEVALAAIDELGLLRLTPSPRANQAYLVAVRQVIEVLAAEGNVVIIGRAGQALLKGRPDILHVRIVAPVELRAQRVSERFNVSIEAALAQVEASDRSRSRYVKRFYHIRWDDPMHYDLVINTAKLTSEAAALLITQAWSDLQQKALHKYPTSSLENRLESFQE
jgi:cytidylate kinase